MNKNNLTGKTIFGKQFMATVSVMIVLLILGVFAAIVTGASNFSDALKSRMGFSVVMSDDVSEGDLKALSDYFNTATFVNEVTFTSAQEVMEQWERDNGENVLDVLGANPFGAQYDITVKPEYAYSDSLDKLTQLIAPLAGVDEVSTTTKVVDGLNNLLNMLSIIFLPLALALLVVSGVLINNTVRLTVYSSRFLIHTMKLVGATGKFIRRPFIKTGIINGVVAGVVSGVVLGLLIWSARSASAEVATFLSWQSLAWIFPTMIIIGVAICGIAAALATNKYLRLDYDEMFA